MTERAIIPFTAPMEKLQRIKHNTAAPYVGCGGSFIPLKLQYTYTPSCGSYRTRAQALTR